MHYYWLQVALVTIMYLFYRTWKSDPGYLPKSTLGPETYRVCTVSLTQLYTEYMVGAGGRGGKWRLSKMKGGQRCHGQAKSLVGGQGRGQRPLPPKCSPDLGGDKAGISPSLKVGCHP